MAYLIGEPYKQRIDRALSVVEGVPLQGNGTRIETRFETLPQPGGQNPLELAAYPRDLEWKKGITVVATLYTQSGTAFGPAIETLSDGSQIPRTVSVSNISNDLGVPNPYGTTLDIGPTPTMTWCLIGKPRRGNQYIAVEGPMVPVHLATISSQQIGSEWAKGDLRTVQITATGQTANVYSVLDSHTKLDFPHGLVYTKSVDPNDPTRTANVVIGPPAIPLHEARFSAGNVDEEWPRGGTKQLLVTRADGEEVQVPVENTFFDTFKPGTATLAIGRFGTTFSVITSPHVSDITPGTLVSPIDPSEQWDAGSIRPVRITGTTTQVDVVNVFEELTPLDGHRGVLFAKSEVDPLGGEGTANILIAPAPKELFEARFSDGNVDEEWERGQTKDLIVPAAGGRSEEIIVPVANKFFDTFKPGTAALAIGKIDGEFCVLTSKPNSDIALANRTDDSEWPRGSQRDVQVHGETRTISVTNLAGHYEAWDAKEIEQGPNLVAVRGVDSGGETGWYLIAPPPLTFDAGTWDGEWSIGGDKAFYLNSNGESVNASNTLFDLPAGGSGAVAKVGDSWKLVSVEMETATATLIEGVVEMPYASEIAPTTVVTDVSVSGEVRQSAASPVSVAVTAIPANYMVVTGVQASATLTQSAANPVSVSTVLQTSSFTVVSDVTVSATLNTETCGIVVEKTNATSAVSVVTGVAVAATLDASKLDVAVAVNPTYSNLSVINNVAVDVLFDVTKLWVELETTATTTEINAVVATAMGTFVESTATFTYLRFPGVVQ